MMRTWHRIVALLAPLLATLAAAGFGSALPGFLHSAHPMALPGAHGVPMALPFNLLAYLGPGLLLAVLAWSWRGMAGAQATGFAGRLGLQLLVLAALAFAAQGLLPLDPRDLDAPASRLHAAAWMLWWIALVAAAVALAWNAARSRAGVAVVLHVASAAIVLFLVLAAGGGGGAALAQRIAVATWFAWVLGLAFAGPLPARRG